MSPDGEDIITGAGDETIKFWKVFKQNDKKTNYSMLPNSLEIR
jgi:cell division cycle 20-like protein 1 (cofactor of APC complex)